METSSISSPAEHLAQLPSDERSKLLKSLTAEQSKELLTDWYGFWARPNQLAPGTERSSNSRKDWRYWLLQAGRGFGKTKSGAEWVRQQAKESSSARIALVGRTAADVRDVMVLGEAGILSCCPTEERPDYQPSRRLLTWPNGAKAMTYSADEPDLLRGPSHTHAWCDELASWRFPDAWDNLMFGLRLGSDPRCLISTTPKPVKLIRDLIADKETVITRASTYENRANLAPVFLDAIVKKYEGTRTGRQELLAELLDDVPGALWTRKMVEDARLDLARVPPLIRMVVSVDPAVTASETSDETGIGLMGLGQDQHLYVMNDVSLRGTPHEWGHAVVRLFIMSNADRIVGEVNNGGDLVESNLRHIDANIPFRSLRASRGKLVRAEPVAALFEQGRVHLVGCERKHPQNPERTMFEGLEDQLCTWTPNSGEKSPDRMDWMVWGAYDLLISPQESYMVGVSPGVQISAY